jgi:hypothetical protein
MADPPDDFHPSGLRTAGVSNSTTIKRRKARGEKYGFLKPRALRAAESRRTAETRVTEGPGLWTRSLEN